MNAPAPSDLRSQRQQGLSAIGGVALGTVVVLMALHGATHSAVRLDLGLPYNADPAELACGSGQCVNFSVGFSGIDALSPSELRISVRPVDPSVVINGSAGAALNLVFSPTTAPQWLGDLGGGHNTTAFEAEIVNPGGGIVGTGTNLTIEPGATLCLKSTASATTVEYTLTLAYGSASASRPFSID